MRWCGSWVSFLLHPVSHLLGVQDPCHVLSIPSMTKTIVSMPYMRPKRLVNQYHNFRRRRIKSSLDKLGRVHGNPSVREGKMGDAFGRAGKREEELYHAGLIRTIVYCVPSPYDLVPPRCCHHRSNCRGSSEDEINGTRKEQVHCTHK